MTEPACRQVVDFVAVDPGAVHCGWAMFRDGDCVRAGEDSPDRLVERLRWDSPRIWVVEEFRLYPWKSDAQAFSQLETVELIGVIKWMAGHALQTGVSNLIDVELIMQSARVKKPTVGQADARGYAWVSKGLGGHAKDAETHGLYYAHKTLGLPWAYGMGS